MIIDRDFVIDGISGSGLIVDNLTNVDVGNVMVMLVLSVVLVTAAVTDWRSGKVYNRLTYSAMLGGIVIWAVLGFVRFGGVSGLGWGALQSFGGLCAGFIPFAILMAMGGLNGGDVKLMGAVGALSASWECVLDTTVYALVVAAVFSIITMVRMGITKRTMQRLIGAAMMAGARVKAEIPQDSPKVPFAVAVCVGGLVAAADCLFGISPPWG